MKNPFKKYALSLSVVALLIFHFSLHSKGHVLSSDVSTPISNTFVYISLDSARSVVGYAMESKTGELHLIGATDMDGSLGALAVDPKHRILYAANRSKNRISTYKINSTTGKLSLTNTITAAGNPVYLSTDRTGKFLLTAYFADSKAAVYTLGDNGIPQEAAVETISTELHAHAILTDLTNRYLFIPCRTGETIHQFKFDDASGFFTPNTPDRVHTDSLTGPRHLTFHTKLNVVYVINEFGSTVTAYQLDPEGRLAAFQSLSTLPPQFTGHNSAADIHLTPDNRFLYASNRGDESIAAFAVDSVSGSLTSVGIYATEKTPRAFDIDPDGNYLYVGGQGSGKLAAYRIDHRTGQLTLLKTYDVGNHPAWVIIVPMNTLEKR